MIAAARREGPRATLRWFLYARLISTLTLLGLLLVLHEAAPDQALGIPAAMCITELAANGLWAAWLNRGRRLSLLIALQFITDIACISVGVLKTGGPTSPFVPLYTIVVLSAGLLSVRSAVTYAVVCGASLLGVFAAPPSWHSSELPPILQEGGAVLSSVIVLVNTAVVVSFFRMRTLAEQEKLRRIKEVLQRSLDDVTHLERQQRTLNQNLQASMQARSQFLALMSHELRTPLNSVIGFADLLLDESVRMTDVERKTFAAHIQRGGRHLLAIIDNLIDLSRLSAGTLELRIEPIDVGHELHDACENARRAAQERGIDLDCAVRDALSPIETDRRRVRQIVDELIANALRHTPAGGSVRVSADPLDAGVRICVRDTGEGIPEDHLARIFEPFHQVDSSTRRPHEGTGLGLALVRTFAEAMGGRVEAESEVAKGTTVSLILPARPSLRPG